ncbi:MAG: hypothetical protein ABIT61_09430 [Steroidobacteraceae bacterium]
MSNRLDELLARVADRPSDRTLDSLEAEIARRITTSRRDQLAVAALVPVQVAAISLSLALGIAVGGVVAMSAPLQAQRGLLFENVAPLAPSTLLEGRE